MFGESFQSGFWHRIHGEGPGKGLNVQDVGGFGVLGSSAGPEKALGTGAGVQDAHPPWRVKQSAVSLIGLSGDGDATEPTSGFSPAEMRRSMPRRYASAAATYCAPENSRVTLTGTPAKIASSMAGRPSLVPGILMKRLGRSARACRVLAAARVAAVLRASRGETSKDTQPSTRSVWSWIGRNKSAACCRSSIANSKKRASPDLPSFIFRLMASS